METSISFVFYYIYNIWYLDMYLDVFRHVPALSKDFSVQLRYVLMLSFIVSYLMASTSLLELHVLLNPYTFYNNVLIRFSSSITGR